MSVRRIFETGILLLLLAAWASAQQARSLGGNTLFSSEDEPVPVRNLPAAPAPVIDVPTARPRMSPELALRAYQEMAQRQTAELAAYSDQTIVEADLPDTHQHGRYELRRNFLAPKSLAYGAIRFIGDGFVKTNVIVRLLQSEVDHTEKGDTGDIAILERNYKFSFKSVDSLGERQVYAFQVKPRRKVPGLFKGKIYLDVTTGRLLRAEGSMIKSPSFFIKKVEFVQDYAAIGEFNFPARLHSVAKTRIVGRAIVDVTHTDYQAKSVAQAQSDAAAVGPTSGPSN